jgi:hypothetical protein
MATLKIKVVDRKGDTLHEFAAMPASTTVEELKKTFLKDSEFGRKLFN